MIPIDEFLSHQTQSWALLYDNATAIAHARRTTVELEGVKLTVQIMPSRTRSVTADVSTDTIKRRECFLCQKNRPTAQASIQFGEFEILANPYPILPGHLTIAHTRHLPQDIKGKITCMIALAKELDGYTVFFNGAGCGASAPDHMHFQAVPSKYIPLWQSNDRWPLCHVITLTGIDASTTARHAEDSIVQLCHDEYTIGVNVLARYCNNKAQIVIIPRIKHRPDFFGNGPDQMLLSPASLEMAGVITLIRDEDFNNPLLHDYIKRMYDQVGLHSNALAYPLRKKLKVRILTADNVEISVNNTFELNSIITDAGALNFAVKADGSIMCGDLEDKIFNLKPKSDDTMFTIHNVNIGIDFHWQRNETQSFRGQIEVAADITGKLCVYNIVDIEDYIESVISSEINASAPLEFLKAHAVISRSWALAQIYPPKHTHDHSYTDTPEELIRWYDRDNHTGFDLCADDHCQRYQGHGKATTHNVRLAIKTTRGLILSYNGEIADARFSKCCGGVTEKFSSCWQDADVPYLVAESDSAYPEIFPDLTLEAEAIKWIMGNPDSFCASPSENLLAKVLNNYDRETADFYRWRVDYDALELSDIIQARTGMDFGLIKELTPVLRGPSGRIVKLRIVGQKLTRIVGKELEIRRTLSRSHLYSSCFHAVPYGLTDESGYPTHWTLYGAGWGHGVGLCQIGAAKMADMGYDYLAILNHYFPGATLVPIE